MSLDDQLVAMSETQPWKFFALQGLNFQFLELNFQFLEGNFKMSEPCVMRKILFGLILVVFTYTIIEGLAFAALTILRSRIAQPLRLSKPQKIALEVFSSDDSCFPAERYKSFKATYPDTDEILQPHLAVNGELTCFRLSTISDQVKVNRDAFNALLGLSGSAEFNPSLGWDTRPNASFYIPYPAIATYNSDGIRSLINYSLIKAPDIVRIAACGDSFTHGHDVSDTEAWTYLLEKNIENVEVLNFGVGFYSLGQSYLKYSEKVKKYKPDIVFIGYYDTNLERDVNRFRYYYAPRDTFIPTAPRFEIIDDKLALVPNPIQEKADYRKIIEGNAAFLAYLGNKDFFYDRFYFPGLLDKSSILSLTKRAVKTAFRRLNETSIYRKNTYNPDSEAYKVVTALFSQFYADVIADGAKPLIIIFPSRQSLELYRMQGVKMTQPLIEYLTKNGLAYFDLLEDFEQLAPNRSMDELFHGHYTPLGNQIVALVIKSRLLAGTLLRPAVEH